MRSPKISGWEYIKGSWWRGASTWQDSVRVPSSNTRLCNDTYHQENDEHEITRICKKFDGKSYVCTLSYGIRNMGNRIYSGGTERPRGHRYVSILLCAVCVCCYVPVCTQWNAECSHRHRCAFRSFPFSFVFVLLDCLPRWMISWWPKTSCVLENSGSDEYVTLIGGGLNKSNTESGPVSTTKQVVSTRQAWVAMMDGWLWCNHSATQRKRLNTVNGS